MSSAGGILVGGEPQALLAASSYLYEAASRTDDVGRQLAGALGPAVATILAAAPFAPVRAAAVHLAVRDVLVSPGAGLASVAAAYHAVSLQLRQTGQALEAAGAVGLLATGGLGLLRGERPTVLASADGVDLRREVATGTWSGGPVGQSSALAVREVRRPDGTSFFVVEATVGGKVAEAAGVQVNGVGGFVEAAAGTEVTLRWAVPTLRDAQLMVAAVSGPLVVGGKLVSFLPEPTEAALAVTASATALGGIGPVPGLAPASGTVAVRHEVTTFASGGGRFATTYSAGGQAGLVGVTGTGGAGSVRVTVDRNAAGAVSRVGLTATTEVDRGRHGLPLLEAGNREATLVEREWEVELTPERRAAADRIAGAMARGDAPDRADLEVLADGARDVKATERTYDVRHQQASVDVAVKAFDGGGGAAVDTAVLREPP